MDGTKVEAGELRPASLTPILGSQMMLWGEMIENQKTDQILSNTHLDGWLSSSMVK